MAKNKKRPKLQQRLAVAFCGLLLGFSIVPPASAYLSEAATDLAPWLALLGINIDPYIEELEAIESFYAQVVNADVDDILRGLEWTLGEIGLPIAGEIPDEIQKVVTQVAADLGIYTPSNQKLEDALMSEANKKYADAQFSILLGQEGQQEIQDSLEANAKIVAASSNSAQLVQGMTGGPQGILGMASQGILGMASQGILGMASQGILGMASQGSSGMASQGILREQALIEANNSVLLGSIYEELVLSRINETWGNQHNAVLAADVQRKNWEEEVTKTSHRAYIMRSTAEAFSYGMNPTSTIP